MHNGALKKMALALAFWLALYMSQLKAQILGPYGTSPTTFEVDTNGLLSDTGTEGVGTLSLSGNGTRMLWYPGKAAFRAGRVSGTEWDDANIGIESFVLGSNSIASGLGSFSLGEMNQATNIGSVAIGTWNSASGSYSISIGFHSYASGRNSMVLGEGRATGLYSTAIGVGSSSSGTYTTALGIGSTASGYESMAQGTNATAIGNGSNAIGDSAVATGEYSIALGYTTASAYDAVTIGQANVGGGNPTAWIPTDPLFEIGDGAPPNYTPSDAFVVYKNGNTVVQGTLTVQTPSGDIPMYTGNNNP